MSQDIKTFHLAGAAAKEYLGGGKKRTAKRKEGGNQPIIRISGTEEPLHTYASPHPSTWLKYPSHEVPPVIKGGNQKAPVAIPTVIPDKSTPVKEEGMEGGVKHITVKLKKKEQTKRVKLQPKKIESKIVKHQTKKNRKITVGISSLHKRITRAKKFHKHIKEMSVEDIKKLLIAKKLIKPTSKAPESVLRQIASDAQLVAKRML
jgi:hypothetical protein